MLLRKSAPLNVKLVELVITINLNKPESAFDFSFQCRYFQCSLRLCTIALPYPIDVLYFFTKVLLSIVIIIV